MMAVVSYDPRTGNPWGSIPDTPVSELESVVSLAKRASGIAENIAPAERRRWLHALADALDIDQDALAERGDEETALGLPRLRGEVSRTAAQLRFYAEVACEGSYLQATRDDATESSPAIARTQVPLGAIGVFGASNFPFAFGILGNDTASALAAGCAVVAKAHPAHPLLSQRLHLLAVEALRGAGAPDGLLGMVHGFDSGTALVQHPEITAIAFTGSQTGGMSLNDLAKQREIPIPVFAEMGTVNPVVVTPAAGADMKAIAREFVGSFSGSNGQVCTKPGLLLAPRGAEAVSHIANALEAAPPSLIMLSEGIAGAVHRGVDELQSAGGFLVSHVEPSTNNGWTAPAAVLNAPIDSLTRGSRLLEECFGAVAIVAEYENLDEALAVVDRLQGALAGSIFAADDDPDTGAVIQRLRSRVGRVVVNGWPTGVLPTWAQHHGGPWPATSNPVATSVGSGALDRFLRPVAFQSVPDHLLPAAIREGNPWGLPQRINGVPARSNN